MDQFENLKTNYNRTADNFLNELCKTKEIVAAITDKDLVCETIIITSEELISVDSENVEKSLVNRLESLGNKQNCIYIFELENENNIDNPPNIMNNICKGFNFGIKNVNNPIRNETNALSTKVISTKICGLISSEAEVMMKAIVPPKRHEAVSRPMSRKLMRMFFEVFMPLKIIPIIDLKECFLIFAYAPKTARPTPSA